MAFRQTALGIVAGLALGTIGCRGGTTPPANNAPAAETTHAPDAATIKGDLLKDWQGQKDMMMKIADAMPEDKFGYKATPAERNYGEQIMHIALTNVELLNTIGGTAPAPAVTAESAKSKADI